MRKTDKKHDEFVELITKGAHYKYNRIAETSLFIEVFQVGKTGNRSYQRWANDDTCKIVLMGNEKIVYVFDPNTLKQLIAKHNIVPNNKKTGYGFVISSQEAKTNSKYWYNV